MSTKITATERNNAISTLTDAAGKQAELLKVMGIPQEAFARLCINALMRNPDLAKCRKDSLYQSVYRAIEMGMIPDGKQGAIVPLRRKGSLTAEFWPMIDGLLTKVRQNIPGISIQAHNVFRGDEWDDTRGSSPMLVHRPDPDAEQNESTLIASYATAHMPNNSMPEIVVMYRSELEGFKKKNAGPWAGHPLEMYRIRPLKRLVKRLPISGGLAVEMASLDDDLDPIDYDTGEIIEQEVEKKKPEPKQAVAPEEPAEAPEEDFDDLTAGMDNSPEDDGDAF